MTDSPEARRETKTTAFGVGDALIHSASVTLAQTAVLLTLVSHLRGEFLSRSLALQQAHEWLLEARALVEADIGTPVGNEPLP